MFFPNNLKVLAIFGLTALLLNFNHPLSADEGAVLDGAWKIKNGQVIYRDFFSFVAPGSFYLVKWSFDLFGPHYWSAKLTSLVLLLLSVYAIYKTTNLLTNIHSISLISAWLWLVVASNVIFYPIISYNSHSTFIATLSIYFLILAIKSNNWRNYFIGGLLLSIVIVFLQHKGIILSFALVLFLTVYVFANRIKFSNFLITFITLFTLPVITAFIWSPNILLENLILWSIKHDIAQNSIPPTNLLILIFVFILSVIWIAKRQKVDQDSLLAIAIAQISALISIYSRIDLGHILMNSFGLIIVFSYLIYKLSSTLLKKLPAQAKFLIGGLFLLLFLGISSSMNVTFYQNYKKFRRIIAKHQIRKIYAHPFLPQMYFELRAESPYRYDTLFTGIHPQEYFLDNLTVLLIESPKHVLARYDVVNKFNYNIANPLDNYILTHYQPIDSFDGLIFLEKR